MINFTVSALAFAFVGMIFIIITNWVLYKIVHRPPSHCEKCGKPLKRNEWAISSYSGTTGKPDRWERWAWCSTQASYRIPRPPLLHELGATVPDDDDFEVSHNTMLEHRGGGF